MKTGKKLLVKKFCLALLIFTTIFSQKAFSQSWSTLGTGMNDWVYASTVYNGDLIVGGKFTDAGGVSANHIARWDGSNWYPLGLGVNAKVWALASFGGSLYVGGEFTEAGGIPMLGIARWDGTNWINDLGDMNDIVTSFAVYNNALIAGGYFIEADGLPVNNIAQYKNGHWAALGSGVVGTQGSVMALEVYNNELIAGGFFTSAGGASASHIAKWNGTTWSALGSGISNIVYSLTNYNSNLIAGGLFSSAGLIPANNIASWNGSSWSALGTGMSGIFYQSVFALKTYNGNLIAGGYFTHSDGLLTNGIAKWNGSAWSDMGGGLFEPGNVCGTHTLCLYGQYLIDGGLFNTAGDAYNARNIASWNMKVLALNSINLKATQNNDAIIITWQTLNESNKKSFMVERSMNALDFVGINTIPAKDNASSYTYTDKTPLDGINYYRIRENAINGSHTFSPVVKVVFNVSSIVSLYPNHAKNTVTVKGLNKNIITIIKIFSMQGSEISRQNLTQSSAATLNISALPQGTYLIQVVQGSNVVGLKLVKE
jgi:hypothetical protein